MVHFEQGARCSSRRCGRALPDRHDLRVARRDGKALPALETIVKEAPTFLEAHVTLATVYYRLKRREDGDRERAIIETLNKEIQAKQPGAVAPNTPDTPPVR